MRRADDARSIRRLLVDPRRVLTELGLLKGALAQPHGYTVRCPAHGDSTPSCSVTVGADGTIRVRCFGCDLSGDVLTLIAAVEGLDLQGDFRAVLVRASELAGYDLARADKPSPTPRRADPIPPLHAVLEKLERPGPGSHPSRRAASRRDPVPAPPPPPPPPCDFDAVAQPILALGRLDGSELVRDVVAYLDGRGLLAAARADGWAGLPAGADTLAAWASVLRAALPAEHVEGAGLLKGPSWVWASHRLVIPWRDLEGRVVTFQRRAVAPLADGLPKYVFPKGHRPAYPYGAERLAKFPADAPIAFVEGAVDVLAARELGLSRATGQDGAVLGLPGVTTWLEEWGPLVTGRVIVLGVDADNAGDAAVNRLAARIYAAGARAVKRARPPRRAKDWAAALVSQEEAA
jgi:DNA primase